ncbi:hypothetical protein [Flavobacterium rhizosphaerae]|uniref:Uncharacterized protein n=1 Tax=Flavobacterium rhizosphaerae TaxID=3163298 RepID=A0ABW8YVT4_9FLAO
MKVVFNTFFAVYRILYPILVHTGKTVVHFKKSVIANILLSNGMGREKLSIIYANIRV